MILENGQVAVFALENLLPPGDRRGVSRDFKDVLDERGQTQFGSSAFLHSVSSIRDRLRESLFIIEPELPRYLRSKICGRGFLAFGDPICWQF